MAQRVQFAGSDPIDLQRDSTMAQPIAQSFPGDAASGRIKYYGSMPNGTTTTITGTWPSFGSTDQRFWVEVIDHMLGFIQTASATYQDLTGNQSSTNQMIGYGGDITWGTKSTNSVPSSTPQPYMNYKDNPLRPLLLLV